MLKTISIVYAIVQIAILLTEDLFAGQEKVGDAKKAEAFKQVDTLLAAAGVKRPAFLTDALLGTLIDVLVGVANATGVFRKAA